MTLPRPGCFGKLPVFADFLRHNAAGTEVEELDQWFQGGIFLARQTMGKDWETVFDAAPQSCFIFSPVKSKMLLVGVVTAGTDKAGRKFPFAVFHPAEAALFKNFPSLLPRIFGDFLDEAEELAREGWRRLDARGLVLRIEGFKPAGHLDVEECRRRHEAFLRDGISPFFASIGLVSTAPGKKRVADELKELLGPNHRGRLGSIGFGLKLPLPPRAPGRTLRDEVSVWLELITRLGGVRGFPSVAFWSQGDEKRDSNLFIFFGDPSPRHFLSLIRPDQQSDRIWEIVKDYEDPVDLSSLDFGPMRVDPALTLAQWIERIAHVPYATRDPT